MVGSAHCTRQFRWALPSHCSPPTPAWRWSESGGWAPVRGRFSWHNQLVGLAGSSTLGRHPVLARWIESTQSINQSRTQVAPTGTTCSAGAAPSWQAGSSSERQPAVAPPPCCRPGSPLPGKRIMPPPPHTHLQVPVAAAEAWGGVDAGGKVGKGCHLQGLGWGRRHPSGSCRPAPHPLRSFAPPAHSLQRNPQGPSSCYLSAAHCQGPVQTPGSSTSTSWAHRLAEPLWHCHKMNSANERVSKGGLPWPWTLTPARPPAPPPTARA